MGAAYGRDVVKVDLLVGYNRAIRPKSISRYWRLFKDKGVDYRLHWGKALSDDVEYIRRQYPRWDDFMRLRDEMDPHQVFVTDYWRRHLGITPVK
jgi:D-arabinono-1,4-lactone oxidase